MTDNEISVIIVVAFLAAIVIGGLAVDAWHSWQDRRRHKRLLRYLDNANRDHWYDGQ